MAGEQTIEMRDIRSPEGDRLLTSVLLDPGYVPTPRAGHIPLVRVSRDGRVYERIRGAFSTVDRMDYRNRYPPGDYNIVSAILRGQDNTQWLLSPQPVGEGGMAKVYFVVDFEHEHIGAAKVARDVKDNEKLENEARIFAQLSGRPEIAENMTHGLLPDGRRVNIAQFYKAHDLPVWHREWHMVDVDTLSPENLLRLVALQHFAHKRWIQRGVPYLDWQQEEALLFHEDLGPQDGTVESFVAIDFSAERLEHGEELRIRQASAWGSFAIVRMFPLVNAAISGKHGVKVKLLSYPNDRDRVVNHFGPDKQDIIRAFRAALNGIDPAESELAIDQLLDYSAKKIDKDSLAPLIIERPDRLFVPDPSVRPL